MSTPTPSSAGGIVYLIFIQVASRGLTFIGNQVLLSYLSPTLLGIAVQLELVSVTILYFARESLRTALQRQPAATFNGQDKNNMTPIQQQSQTGVNLSYLAVSLGLIIALVSGLWYLRAADVEVLTSPFFIQAYYIYAAATLIELCAEPFFVVIQQHSLYRQRAQAETSGAIGRCICACATAFIATKQGVLPSVLPFAVGQLAYSIVLFFMYLQAASRISHQLQFNLILQPISDPSECFLSLFSKPILSLAATMYIQSIFKLFLSEGDHVILSFLSSLADQGAFALASNYGGLLARLVFQPIEESSRNIFGRLLSSPNPTSISSSPSFDTKYPSTSPTYASKISVALSHLSTTLRTYLTLSLPLCSILPPFLPTLIPILLRPHWRTPATTLLLQTYIYYIPFIAVNGILDAFVTSVATPKELTTQSIAMAFITIIYGGACYLFLRVWGWGSPGLVGAGIVNMGLRILWGVWFVGRWLRRNQLQGKRSPVRVSNDEKTKTLLKNQHLKEARGRFWKECIPSTQSTVVAVATCLWLNSEWGITSFTASVDSRHSHTLPLKGIPILSNLEIDVVDVGKLAAAMVVVGSTLVFYDGAFLLGILRSAVPDRILRRIPFLGSLGLTKEASD